MLYLYTVLQRIEQPIFFFQTDRSRIPQSTASPNPDRSLDALHYAVSRNRSPLTHTHTYISDEERKNRAQQ